MVAIEEFRNFEYSVFNIELYSFDSDLNEADEAESSFSTVNCLMNDVIEERFADIEAFQSRLRRCSR